MTIETLNGLSSGVYRVTTESSEYIVDLDTSRLMRFPNSDEDTLRKNGYWFTVNELSCTIGESMFLSGQDTATKFDIIMKDFSKPVVHITKEEMIPDGWDK